MSQAPQAGPLREGAPCSRRILSCGRPRFNSPAGIFIDTPPAPKTTSRRAEEAIESTPKLAWPSIPNRVRPGKKATLTSSWRAISPRRGAPRPSFSATRPRTDPTGAHFRDQRRRGDAHPSPARGEGSRSRLAPARHAPRAQWSSPSAGRWTRSPHRARSPPLRATEIVTQAAREASRGSARSQRKAPRRSSSPENLFRDAHARRRAAGQDPRLRSPRAGAARSIPQRGSRRRRARHRRAHTWHRQQIWATPWTGAPISTAPDDSCPAPSRGTCRSSSSSASRCFVISCSRQCRRPS